jgi:hypothetical protein
MSMGPVLIFDKSTLQSLSLDEAVWLDNFYITNITPLFFIETLADLEKAIKQGRTPEQIVGSIALKTPKCGASPNVSHLQLCRDSLMGNEVEARGVPVLGGGIPVVSADRKGMMYKQSPELEAFHRWQDGKFLEVERGFAKSWREGLSKLDFAETYRQLRPFLERGQKPRELHEVKELVDRLLRREGYQFAMLNLATQVLGVPASLKPDIVRRWKSLRAPLLPDFAPYAAYVFGVELFFSFGLAADLISRDRSSNRIDIAYLEYLPFCMVFASNDRLHERTVPLFLRDYQKFIGGQELKSDLKSLDDYYSCLPAEVRERGVWSFASYPPPDDSFLVTRLWDRYLPKWRENAKKQIKLSPEKERELIERFNRMKDEAKVDYSGRANNLEPDHVTIERRLPVWMGKWRILPPEVEKDAK